MQAQHELSSIRSINRHLRWALAACALLVIGGGGLAIQTELSGAVLASGTVVVDANVKEVQHPLGGVVETIHVRNGASVKQGDVLMRLEDDVAAADLALVDNALDALLIRKARLEAERDGRTSLEVDTSLLSNSIEVPPASTLMRSETKYLASRIEARAGLKAQLAERIAQTERQIDGIWLQTAAQQDALDLLRSELDDLEGLFDAGLVTKPRISELSREGAEIRGLRGQLVSERAAQHGRIAELKLQIIQIDQDMLSEVSKELRETEEKIADLAQRRVGALDQLKRIDIRAPHDGLVHQLVVHTEGGVIEAGERIMLIVPEGEALSIEVKVAAQDRDQIHLGQNTLLRMSSFNQRTTPELAGVVSLIGADLVEDSRTGLQYYPVRIALEEGEEARLGQQLAPGMPVEAFVQTGYRTIFSYLTKPLADYFVQAFRAD
jgi:HlyD family secretion protein